MSSHLQKRYKLNLLKREVGDSSHVNFKDAFSAVALLLWKPIDLCKAAGLEQAAGRYTQDQQDEAAAKISM